MKGLFLKLQEQMEKGEDSILVSVVASSGSTPRGAGARMLLGGQGRVYGTIGGGAVEYRSQQAGLDVLREGRSGTMHFALNASDVSELGMVCGGDVTAHFQYMPAKDAGLLAFVRQTLALFSDPQPCWLVTDITEGRQWEMHTLHQGEQPGWINAEEAAALMQSKPVRKAVDGREYYAEPLVRAGIVYVFGGGHVAQELVPVLSHVGFRCIVLEDRPEFARESLFPGVIGTIVADFDRLGDYVQVTGHDYIVVMTRGHENDYVVEKFALGTPACYIGVIGSKAKTKHINGKLLEEGFTMQQIKRVYTPIGLDIKGDTPAEIAISIAGEMIRVRAEQC